MRSIVIGLGETGGPLQKVLGCDGYDPKYEVSHESIFGYEILNICIPYSEKFVEIVKSYQNIFKPSVTIIHSTVPIGTTSKIPNAVHSPILGKHGSMEQSIKNFTKWVGGPLAEEAAEYLESAGIKCKVVETSEETEAMKLMCLATYGVSLAMQEYRREICEKYNIPFSHIWEWDMNYNNNVASHLKRPILDPPNGECGGHCVSQNTEILFFQSIELFGKENLMLKEVLRLARPKKLDKSKPDWTKEEDERLKRLAQYFTFKEIAGLMPNRTYDSVRIRAIKLGISSIYSPSERDIEVRRKISSSLRGISEREWDGFVGDDNARIRHSEHYAKWRDGVFERDGYTCQKCGIKSGNGKAVYLHAHHIKSFADFPEHRLDVNNGVTYCDTCHRNVHFGGGNA